MKTLKLPKVLHDCEMITITWVNNVLIYNVKCISDVDVIHTNFQSSMKNIYTSLRNKNHTFYQIFNTNNVEFSITQMKYAYKFAQFLKSQDDIIEDYCTAVAIINDNKFIGNIINKILKLFANKIQVKVVKDEQSAYEYINQF